MAAGAAVAAAAAADDEKKKRIEPKRNPSFRVKNETGGLARSRSIDRLRNRFSFCPCLRPAGLV